MDDKSTTGEAKRRLPNGLTPKQEIFLQEATEAGFDRNITKLAKSSGIPRDRFYKWMKEDPVFKAAWENLWTPLIERHLPACVSAVLERVKRTGDPQGARLILELIGLSKLHIQVENLSEKELDDRIAALMAEARVGASVRGKIPSLEKASSQDSPVEPDSGKSDPGTDTGTGVQK